MSVHTTYVLTDRQWHITKASGLAWSICQLSICTIGVHRHNMCEDFGSRVPLRMWNHYASDARVPSRSSKLNRSEHFETGSARSILGIEGSKARRAFRAFISNEINPIFLQWLVQHKYFVFESHLWAKKISTWRPDSGTVQNEACLETNRTSNAPLLKMAVCVLKLQFALVRMLMLLREASAAIS